MDTVALLTKIKFNLEDDLELAELKFISKISQLNHINRWLKYYCNHEIKEDYVELGQERTEKIKYCNKCYLSKDFIDDCEVSSTNVLVSPNENEIVNEPE